MILAKRGITFTRPHASFAFSGKAAVVLSGLGVYDGSEATETVSVLVALSKNGVAA